MNAARAAVLVAGSLLAVLAAGPGRPARAQLPYADPLPCWSAADTLAHRSFLVATTRWHDGRSGWTSDRVLIEAHLPLGSHGSFFLRLPWLRFDTGGLAVAARWPEILGPEADPDWPGESQLTGFGQFEVGASGPVSLPGLGPCGAAVAVGVPLGQDRFYPWSNAGLPVRLGLTRWLAPGGNRWWVSVGAVLVTHGGSGDGILDGAAFPDGFHERVGVQRRSGGHVAGFSWERRARGGRREHVLGIEFVAPWGTAGDVGVLAEREISGSPDRSAAWSLGLRWRLTSGAAAATGAVTRVRPPAATSR